jgi:hypothetical protein
MCTGKLIILSCHHISLVQGEWPDVYWKALSSLSKGQAIQVPGPHPKFSMSDMERIARGGPRFEDLVLEHVEMVQVSERCCCRAEADRFSGAANPFGAGLAV